MSDNLTDFIRRYNDNQSPVENLSVKAKNMDALQKAAEHARLMELEKQYRSSVDKPHVYTDPEEAMLAKRASTQAAYEAHPNRAIESAGVFQDAFPEPDFQTVGEPYGGNALKPSPSSMSSESLNPSNIKTLDAPKTNFQPKAIGNNARFSDYNLPTEAAPVSNTAKASGMAKSNLGQGAAGVALSLLHRGLTKDKDEPFFQGADTEGQYNDLMSQVKALKENKIRKESRGSMPFSEDLAKPFMEPTDMNSYFGGSPEAATEAEQSPPKTDELSNTEPQDQITPKSAIDRHIANAIAQKNKAPQEDTALLSAQSLQNKLEGQHGIAKAMDEMLQRIAFRGKPVDSSFYNDLINRSKQPVENLKEQREQEEVLAKLQTDKAKADPMSDVSRMARESLKEITKGMNISIPEGMSAKQIEVLYPYISQAATARAAKHEREVRSQEAAASKANIADVKSQVRLNDYVERQGKNWKNTETYKAYDKIQDGLLTVESAIANPNGIKDVASLYSIVKVLDPTSAVRPGEIALAQEAQGIWRDLKTRLTKAGDNPRVVDPKILKDMQLYISMLRDQKIRTMKREQDSIRLQLQKRGAENPDELLPAINPYYDVIKNTPETEEDRLLSLGKKIEEMDKRDTRKGKK